MGEERGAQPHVNARELRIPGVRIGIFEESRGARLSGMPGMEMAWILQLSHLGGGTFERGLGNAEVGPQLLATGGLTGRRERGNSPLDKWERLPVPLNISLFSLSTPITRYQRFWLPSAMTSLKFKPYVPVPQRPRKLKHTAAAPKRHHKDFTLQDCRGEDQLSQSVAESFSEMNGMF